MISLTIGVALIGTLIGAWSLYFMRKSTFESQALQEEKNKNNANEHRLTKRAEFLNLHKAALTKANKAAAEIRKKSTELKIEIINECYDNFKHETSNDKHIQKRHHQLQDFAEKLGDHVSFFVNRRPGFCAKNLYIQCFTDILNHNPSYYIKKTKHPIGKLFSIGKNLSFLFLNIFRNGWAKMRRASLPSTPFAVNLNIPKNAIEYADLDASFRGDAHFIASTKDKFGALIKNIEQHRNVIIDANNKLNDFKASRDSHFIDEDKRRLFAINTWRADSLIEACNYPIMDYWKHVGIGRPNRDFDMLVVMLTALHLLGTEDMFVNSD